MKKPAEIIEILAEHGQLSAQASFVKTLHSDTNICWLIDDPKTQKQWVVKQLRSDPLAVNWQQMKRNTDQAEAEKLTPKTEYLDFNHGLMMLPYRNCNDLRHAELSLENKIQLCGKLLSKTHDSAMQFNEMDLYSEIQKYITLLFDTEVRSRFLNRAAQLPALPESNYFAGDLELVPCHMDLSFSNVLENEEIIDWEFARQSLPLIDLAFCATINDLTIEQSKLLLQVYQQGKNHEFAWGDFVIYLQWSQLLNDVWYQVAQQYKDAQ